MSVYCTCLISVSECTKIGHHVCTCHVMQTECIGSYHNCSCNIDSIGCKSYSHECICDIGKSSTCRSPMHHKCICRVSESCKSSISDHICICEIPSAICKFRHPCTCIKGHLCTVYWHECSCVISTETCKSVRHKCSCRINTRMCRKSDVTSSHKCICDINPEMCMTDYFHECICLEISPTRCRGKIDFCKCSCSKSQELCRSHKCTCYDIMCILRHSKKEVVTPAPCISKRHICLCYEIIPDKLTTYACASINHHCICSKIPTETALCKASVDKHTCICYVRYKPLGIYSSCCRNLDTKIVRIPEQESQFPS